MSIVKLEKDCFRFDFADELFKILKLREETIILKVN